MTFQLFPVWLIMINFATYFDLAEEKIQKRMKYSFKIFVEI